jgi:cysteinyl-tRNA synthetase
MIKLYDSLTRRKKAFRPHKAGRVTMYNCGPTVYDYVHIGNLRAFLLADLLRRLLEHHGYEVMQIMNITDVGHMLADADEGEDKIQVAAQKAGQTPDEVAKFYAEAFFRDVDRLNIRRAAAYPRASEHVSEMVKLIEQLLAKGHAYEVEADGGVSVYYDVASFKGYGRLSGNRLEALDPGARVGVRSEKRHPADFALWIHNPRHLMQWAAPWGSGYPGWHLECSAMAMKYLGEAIDIHTGGEDNKFPHHECEIAQSEGATGRTFANFWLHVTHLMVEGKKMSKSLGNYYTLADLAAMGHEPRAVRYLLLSVHYRQSLNFTLDGLDGAKAALARLDNFADAVREHAAAGETPDKAGKAALAAVVAALGDDLNVAEALAVAFEYVRATNDRRAKGGLSEPERAAAAAFVEALGDIFGFTFGTGGSDREIPASVTELAARRDEARREKRFAEADALRDQIVAEGFLVEDTPQGTKVKRG